MRFSKISDRHKTIGPGSSENTIRKTLKKSTPRNIMLKRQKAQDKEKILKIAKGGKKKNTLCIEQQIQELHRTSLQKPNNKEESKMKYINY